ncbi:MAG: Holliday junction resolvase RuvX [Planctomycetota bacterium]
MSDHFCSDDSSRVFPQEGRIAAVDFGTVRIGLAICDPDWILASPLEVHSAASDEADEERYWRELVRRERIVAFVVGLPVHCDGGESQKSLECREFAKNLRQQTDLPVRLFDERFTTAAAKQRLRSGKLSRQKKKKKLDAVAALVMLESFIEATRYHGRIAGVDLESPPTGADALDE